MGLRFKMGLSRRGGNKMKKKKWLAIVLAGIMGLAVFAGCGSKGETEGKKEESKEEKDPVEALADSYWTYSFAYDDAGSKMVNYIHFYADNGALGPVYYLGYLKNGSPAAGLYEVVQEKTDWACYPQRGAEEKETGTADYAIIFKDFNGKEIDRCAYDGKRIYNDMTELSAPGATEAYYEKDADGLKSKEFGSIYEGEAGVSVLDMYQSDNEENTLSLLHNMGYHDMLKMAVDGTWKVETKEDGSRVYTLTPDLSSDEGASVTVAADGKTAVYTSDDGSTVNLTVVSNASVTAVYTGETVSAKETVGSDVIPSITLYSDQTAVLSFELVDYGMTQEFKTGTYEGTDGNYTISLDGETYTASGGQIVFQAQIETLGNVDTVLKLSGQE